jgi:hypothetical protein
MRRFAWYSFLTLLTLVVLGVVGVAYLIHNVKVTKVHRASGDEVSLQTPFGDFHVRGNDADPARLGAPIYPGAKRTKDHGGAGFKMTVAEGDKNGADADMHFNGGATFEWTSADGSTDKALVVAGAEYLTPDSPEKVRAWYHDHLPNWVVSTDRHGDNARFELNGGGYKRLIAIREKSDGTHIGVASFGEPASN